MSAEQEYVKVVRRMFTITEQGPAANPLAIQVAYREIARLETAVGVDRAQTLHRAEARAWHATRGINPWSGQRVATYQEPA
jgi:hypothetical protein